MIRYIPTRNGETELNNDVIFRLYTNVHDFIRRFPSPKPFGKEEAIKSKFYNPIGPNPRVTKSNWKEPLKFGQSHFVGDLKIMMECGEQLSGTPCAALLLEPRQYDPFADAISDNGGKASAACLHNTECALPAIIQTAMAA